MAVPYTRQPFGSSPRGRGTYRLETATGGEPRFIPAWAGNIERCEWKWWPSTVHPRVGGEHIIGPDATLRLHPRVGEHNPRLGAQRRVRRFIPLGGEHFHRSPVHPRVGGEHQGDRCSAGSSPRGRGTFLHAPTATASGSWAGNIKIIKPYTGSSPRGRGTYHVADRRVEPIIPAGRGTLLPDLPVLPIGRFIPAWAGNILPGTY